MKKVLIIAQREFSTRITKKSFIISTVIGPLIVASMLILPIYLSTSDNGQKTEVLAIGELQTLPEDNPLGIKIVSNQLSLEENLSLMSNGHYKGIIDYSSTDQPVTFYTNGSPSLVKKIELITPYLISQTHSSINVIQHASSNNKRHPIQEILAYFLPIMVYFFIFLYGIQVMKGIIEEKNNRIMEVLLCTVKPWQLMTGKILGISWLSLVQFIIWGTLSLLTYKGIYSTLHLEQLNQPLSLEQINRLPNAEIVLETQLLLTSLNEMNFYFIGFVFLFFFYSGYLLYACLFAIIGAASDVDTETQQFIFPLTVPLIGTFMLLPSLIENPESTLSKVLSVIPFTSPLSIPATLSFSHEIDSYTITLLVSIIVLTATIIALIFIAAKVYRMGILAQQGNANYKTLIKWAFSKK